MCYYTIADLLCQRKVYKYKIILFVDKKIEKKYNRLKGVGEMNIDLIIKEIEIYIESKRREFLEKKEKEAKGGEILVYLETDIEDVKTYLSKNKEKSFSETLFNFIDSKGMTDSEVYKKAGITRGVFSDIRCIKGRVPVKRNVFALCLSLELSLDESKILLASAGYTFIMSNTFDLIVLYCIENSIYSIMDINMILYKFDIEPFKI